TRRRLILCEEGGVTSSSTGRRGVTSSSAGRRGVPSSHVRRRGVASSRAGRLGVASFLRWETQVSIPLGSGRSSYWYPVESV
ncbi:hypothetical protein BHE74_00023212, partial [Ensete ventricosum]